MPEPAKEIGNVQHAESKGEFIERPLQARATQSSSPAEADSMSSREELKEMAAEKLEELLEKVDDELKKVQARVREMDGELKKIRARAQETAEQLHDTPKDSDLQEELEKKTVEQMSELVKENVKSETGTSSLAAIAAVDGAGSSASKCLKPDSSSEVRISCSDTSAVPSTEYPDIGGLSVGDGIPERVNFTDLPPELMFKEDGIHVWPEHAPLDSGFGAGGQRLTQYNRLDQALRLVKKRGKSAEKRIILHAGVHTLDTTVTINSDIQIIGASAGPDIASQVIIEGRHTAPIVLAKGSQGAYLGWMTVRFAPDSGAVAAAIATRNPRARTRHYALQICGDSTALIEHCVIQSSTTVGAAVCVKGRAANPKMRHCIVSDNGNAGVYVTDKAQGQFEDCEIARNNGPGIWVKKAANPTVTRCKVYHGHSYGILVQKEGRGQIMENRIYSNAFAGIQIASHSDPKITRNKIWDNQEGGILIHNNGQGVLEDNEISDRVIVIAVVPDPESSSTDSPIVSPRRPGRKGERHTHTHIHSSTSKPSAPVV